MSNVQTYYDFKLDSKKVEQSRRECSLYVLLYPYNIIDHDGRYVYTCFSF